MSAHANSPRISRSKRILYSGVIVIGLLVLLELISLAGLWVIEGKVSLSKLHTTQNSLANPVIADAARSPEVLHPYLGWVLNPQFHNETESDLNGSDNDILPSVNSFGFLGANNPVQKRSPDKLIVAILGGSVAWHVSSLGSETLKAELKKSSHFRDKEIVIVRLALSGYKQPQQLFTLAYMLSLGAEFDIVINIDGYNEVALYPAEDARKKMSVAYPRGWYRRVQQLPDPEIVHQTYRLASTKKRRREWAARFSEMNYRYSPTLNLIWICYDNHLQKMIQQDRIAIVSHEVSREAGYRETGPPTEYATEKEMFADLVRLWKNSSLQLERLCRANRIEYHHVLQPNQYLTGSKPMSVGERAVAIHVDSEYGKTVAKTYPLLRKAGSELRVEGVRFHDMTQIFVENQEPIYIDNCCHYNQQGNEILAAAIAREIIANQTP